MFCMSCAILVGRDAGERASSDALTIFTVICCYSIITHYAVTVSSFKYSRMFFGKVGSFSFGHQKKTDQNLVGN